MNRKNPIIGRRFERLTVIRKHKKIRIGKAQKVCYIYECLCDCGNITYVRAPNLYGKQVKSCGCLRVDTISLEKGKAAKNRIYASYKRNATKRGIEFSVTMKQFLNIATQPCFYCGKFSNNVQKGKNGNFIYTGIDRVDNSVGYTVDNIVPSCKICNYAKRDLSTHEFFEWVTCVYSRNIKDNMTL